MIGQQAPASRDGSAWRTGSARRGRGRRRTPSRGGARSSATRPPPRRTRRCAPGRGGARRRRTRAPDDRGDGPSQDADSAVSLPRRDLGRRDASKSDPPARPPEVAVSPLHAWDRGRSGSSGGFPRRPAALCCVRCGTRPSTRPGRASTSSSTRSRATGRISRRPTGPRSRALSASSSLTRRRTSSEAASDAPVERARPPDDDCGRSRRVARRSRDGGSAS